MAIFGSNTMNHQGKLLIFREGNNWDVFLNYFFAVFFIFCFVIGILLNPFIIAYHAQQKRTFAKFLFLLVSSMDMFKSLYFPLVLVPKLLSPLGEDDYYYTMNSKLISWTAYSNTFLLYLIMFELDILVVLSATRYFSITRPLSSSGKRNILFSLILVISLLIHLSLPLVIFFSEFVYIRIIDSLVMTNETHSLIGMCSLFGWSCLSISAGLYFLIQTILYLKNSDTASSNISRQNIRKGIISLIAMSIFNVLVIFSNAAHNIILFVMKGIKWSPRSIFLDFIQFENVYFTPLIQSSYNSLTFLIICSAFRDFAEKIIRERRVEFSTVLNSQNSSSRTANTAHHTQSQV